MKGPNPSTVVSPALLLVFYFGVYILALGLTRNWR
jgi:hypothetical protein